MIGPSVLGQATLLRDIGRVRLETIRSGLIIVDSIGELRGSGDVLHPLLSRAHIFQVGNPSRQGPQPQEAIRNDDSEEMMTDVVQPDDIPRPMEAFNNGTSVVCSLQGKSICDVIDHPMRRALLGIVQNPDDTMVMQRESSIFGMIIKVHGKGLFRVITDVPPITARFDKTPIDYLYFGDWTEEFKQERLAQ